MDRRAILSQSWSMVAEGYLRLFVPRFMPWITEALVALVAARPPEDGAILVPACGPGAELPLLAERLPGRQIVGIDLAQGMAELAAQRLAQTPDLARVVRVVAGDATQLDAGWLAAQGPVGAIFSCFGLQQMPRPAEVLAAWTRALMPGGVLAVCYWPRSVEDQGPWQRMMELTADTARRNAVDWEADIPDKALEEGAELLLDARPEHSMSWPSVDAFWDAMLRAGPWHSRLLEHGEEQMALLRQRFMQAYRDPSAPLSHVLCARLIVLRRRSRVAPTAAL